jgi:DNA polymerase I-like protein with 3'-5' exonuclease and polymerase domains
LIVTFDVETTTKNTGNPFTASNKMVSYGVKIDDRPVVLGYYSDIDFLTALRDGFNQAKLLVGFNIKFDLHWARRYGIVPPVGCRIWDCQIAEFIIRGQRGAYPSLNEALERFGLGAKDDKVAEYWKLGVDTTDIPVDELKFYNSLDVELTYKLYLKQQEAMTEKQKKLCLVQGLDLLVLADMEWNGVKLDVERCNEKADEAKKELTTIAEQLREYVDSPYFNWDSGHHLSCLLYGGAFEVAVPERVEKRIYQSGKRKGEEYEKTYWKTETLQFSGYFTPLKGTKTKLVSKALGTEFSIYASGADVLKQLRKPTKAHRRIVELLLERAEKEKLLSTYYGALPELLEKMEWGDMLHGQYNQVVAATGRLSSSNPNMQNFSGDVDLLLVSRYDS